ncbi:MAG: NAD(P)H-hydrate dehydratase [Jatrophihabitans sp.]|nr:MAG: NAD(P)H-hydrate dehydratase [Jatrophihabitans sp.]
MRGVYPVAQIRAAEQVLLARLPEGALMQRAAHALSVQCADLLDGVYGARVALLVGGGNNGGDALFAGARLARRGARVTAVPVDAGRVHGAGLAALLRAGGRVGGAVPDGADLVVDGMFGIGGRAGLTGRAADLAAAAQGYRTVAVDVPSGVDADAGASGGRAVRADVTVTFGALKTGIVAGDGAVAAGQVRLVDIGLDLPAAHAHVLEAADAAGLLPRPGAHDDKYTRGVVGVVAGCEQYAGAGVLATGAAVHGGAGLVRYLGRAPEPVRARYPEVVVHPGALPGQVQVQAWVVGPGLGTDGAAHDLLRGVLATDVPVIADADAITMIASDPGLVRERAAPTVLTPHDHEFARLAGEVGPDRLGAARRAAAGIGAIVLLKGDVTVVAAPDGTAYLNPTGTPWLGTAGSGDVLSGLVGALLAGGLEPALAAATGAFVHGVAGQQAAAAGPPSATDVLAAIPRATATLAR